jgi:hypothetical protein
LLSQVVVVVSSAVVAQVVFDYSRLNQLLLIHIQSQSVQVELVLFTMLQHQRGELPQSLVEQFLFQVLVVVLLVSQTHQADH